MHQQSSTFGVPMDPAGRDYKRPRPNESYYDPYQAAQYAQGWGSAPALPLNQYPGYGAPHAAYPPAYQPHHGPPPQHQYPPVGLCSCSAPVRRSSGCLSCHLTDSPVQAFNNQSPYGQYTHLYTPYMQHGHPQYPSENHPPRTPGQLSGVKRNWDSGESPHELNRRITASYSPMEICQMACDHSATFDAVNVATCLHRIAKHRPTSMQQIVSHPGYNLIVGLVGTHIRKFQAQQLANILWAFATIEAQPPRQLLTVRRASNAQGQIAVSTRFRTRACRISCPTLG